VKKCHTYPGWSMVSFSGILIAVWLLSALFPISVAAGDLKKKTSAAAKLESYEIKDDTPRAFLTRLKSLIALAGTGRIDGVEFTRRLTGMDFTVKTDFIDFSDVQLRYKGLDKVLLDSPDYHFEPLQMVASIPDRPKNKKGSVVLGIADPYYFNIGGLAFDKQRFCITPSLLYEILGPAEDYYYYYPRENHLRISVYLFEDRDFTLPIPGATKSKGSALYSAGESKLRVEADFTYKDDQCSSFLVVGRGSQVKFSAQKKEGGK